MTPEEYTTIFKHQDGRCALCNEEKKLTVDHNHDSGVVRGLLCYQCNSSLWLLDNVPAGRIMEYLKTEWHFHGDKLAGRDTNGK